MEALAHISLDAILSNYRYLQDRVAPATVIPVVKADAYGHGALQVTGALVRDARVALVAVATVEEAQALAQAFPGLGILIFSRIFTSELSALPEHAIVSIGSLEDWQALAESAQTSIRAHLNVNTGMNRLGLSQSEVEAILKSAAGQIRIEGLYSHFSSSDTASDHVYAAQKSRFAQIVESARALGFTGVTHLSNSAAALRDGSQGYWGIRLGIALYGYDTTPEALHQERLQPAMEVKAPLIRVTRVTAGESVSYAERWTASRSTNIGTLRIGYADGYDRHLTNRGAAVLGGKAYPVVGTVTMDHIMIDLGEDAPACGSYFSVLGGPETPISINRIARLLDTIPYEVTCKVSPRVKRVY